MPSPRQRAIEVASVKVGLMAYRLATEIVQALEADRLLADAEELQRVQVRAQQYAHTLDCVRDLIDQAPPLDLEGRTLIAKLSRLLAQRKE